MKCKWENYEVIGSKADTGKFEELIGLFFKAGKTEITFLLNVDVGAAANLKFAAHVNAMNFIEETEMQKIEVSLNVSVCKSIQLATLVQSKARQVVRQKRESLFIFTAKTKICRVISVCKLKS